MTTTTLREQLFRWHGGQWSGVYSVASTLECNPRQTGNLNNPEFRLAGIEDIRGRIYNQPGRLYARLETSIDGVSVGYHGVVESEVEGDFFDAAL